MPELIETTPHRHSGTFARITKYLLVRAASIALTVFVGVFITVLIANRAYQIDDSVYQEALAEASQHYPPGLCHYSSYSCDEDPEKVAALEAINDQFAAAYGLHLPFLPRHLLWTVRALSFDLGHQVRFSGTSGSYYSSPGAAAAILEDFPHTLMLIGPAFFLLFIAGIPLSLYLFRKHGSRLDRFFTVLAPVSSIPSWVIGILLVMIFSIAIHLLPPSGMFDSVPADNWFEKFFIVLKHMLLPILAIFLSMFFQLLYTWKTFFMLYATEDYVDLAKAKGLSDSYLEKRYILRPTLPYILTNFSLALVTFWQMTIVLEYIFNWPGIGRMYILSLPNFNGESLSPGIMPIIVLLVVLFAYILGVTVLVLDILYALLDPRVRLGGESQTVQPLKARRPLDLRFWQRRRRDKVDYPAPARLQASLAQVDVETPAPADVPPKNARKNGFFRTLMSDLRHYPSAIFGLAVILLLIIGSIIAVTAFPYNKLATLWSANVLTGKSYVPKTAKPFWINKFLSKPLPASMFFNSASDPSLKTTQPAGPDGATHSSITFKVDYPYGGYPQDLVLYFTANYSQKRPFVTLKWLTPDGRELTLDNLSPQTGLPYNFSRDLKPNQFLAANPPWRTWFSFETWNATPLHYLLFSDPSREKPVVLPGAYTLQVDISTFEPASNVEAELVLLGQVYGWAGTDYMRRDLVVPLLWGMPFALAMGLVGATLTAVFSMLLAAMCVWYGGGLDSFIQRLTEGIMVLPIIAIGVVFYAYFHMSIWTFLALIALLGVFGTPTKSFRAALLQVKDSPYLEWAKASGASNARIILRYLLPNILPMIIPQLVALIPSYVFLEATLGIFGVKSDYPTWGKIIFEALRNGAMYGSSYWVLEPVALLLLTGLAFAMLGFALERILNPRLRNV